MLFQTYIIFFHPVNTKDYILDKQTLEVFVSITVMLCNSVISTAFIFLFLR